MDYRNYIESRPEVLLGKPVFKNTRISVDLILERFAQGATVSDLLEAYPSLSTDAIKEVHNQFTEGKRKFY